MSGVPKESDALRLVSSQKTYYDLRAPDFGDESKTRDRRIPGLLSPALAAELVDALSPTGDVLELACGPGIFTRELARHTRSVTALDASQHMLARNRDEVADPKVVYVNADIFDWSPDRVYDVVFFGFWLSHVPPAAFEEFWALVRRCLRSDGLVAFVDEDERATAYDEVLTVGDVPAARRTLDDGRKFDIVKVFWTPADLEERLDSLGWDIRIRRVGEAFMYGVGRTQRAGSADEA
jgi:SAM-dependent methyltransferase